MSLKTAKLRDGRTRLKALVVTGLRKGDKIKLACAGKGCVKKVRGLSRTAKGAKLDLTKSIRKVALAQGARLTITVTRRGVTGRVFRYTMVRRKRPKPTALCLKPGASRPEACTSG